MGDILGGQLSTNENGRTTLTGAGSDINFGKQIDKIIEAKRQPAVRLEGRIQENQTKVDALNQLQQRLSTFQQAANELRGRVAVNNQGDVFESKSGFLSASRTDNTEPSKANSILTANVDNDAQVGSHNLEILQTAQRQRVTSDDITNPDDDLGLSGDFRINGREVSVQTSDNLSDVAQGINNAFSDAGEEESVNASITNLSSNESVLSLQGPEGKAINFEDTSGDVLENLGVLDSNKAVKNEKQAAQVAKFRADSQSDGSVKETIAVADKTAQLSTQVADLETNDDLQFTLTQGPTIINESVEIGTKSLEDIANELDNKATLSAETVETDSGNFRLQVAAKATNNAQQSGFFESGQSLDDLNIDASGELQFTVDDNTEPSPATTETVNLNGTDTLADVVNKINNTGVAAARLVTNSDGQESVVVESASGERLDITDAGGGRAAEDLNFAFADKGGTVTGTGTSGSGDPSAILSAATDPGETLASAFPSLDSAQKLDFEVFDKQGNSIDSTSTGNFNAGSTTLRDLRDTINDQFTDFGNDTVEASIVNDGGQDRLLIKTRDGTNRVKMTEGFAGKDINETVFNAPSGGTPNSPQSADRLIVSSANTSGSGNANGGDPAVGGGAIAGNDELGITDANVLTRDSNKVENLFEGTTLNLLKAEKGTEVKLDVERDLASVKESINKFVEAFNGVKRFINAQRQERALEGQDPEAENSIVGALKGETILNEVEQDINRVVSTGAENVDSDFSVLRQIGIEFVDNDSLTDPTREDTLKINSNDLDDKLLNDFNDVRKLFEFDFQSPNSGLSLIGTSQNTGAADGTLTVSTDSNGNVDDSAPLEVQVDGDTFNVKETSDNVLQVQDGPLEGLTLQADLGDNLSGASIDVSTSRGIGFNAFYTAQDLSNNNPQDGVVESKIAELVGSDSPDIEGQNERFRDEIERIERQLDRERERLLQQFTAAEEALIELESAQQRLTQFAGGGGGSSNG